MAAWHRSRRADVLLRVAGLLLLAVSYLAGSHLLLLLPVRSPDALGPLAWGLFAAGFASASVGGALLTQGRHLFDEVELGARWRRDRAGGADEWPGRPRDR